MYTSDFGYKMMEPNTSQWDEYMHVAEPVRHTFDINTTNLEGVITIIQQTNRWTFDVLQQLNIVNCLLVMCLLVMVLILSTELGGRTKPLRGKQNEPYQEITTA
jgi:hypothetical protein